MHPRPDSSRRGITDRRGQAAGRAAAARAQTARALDQAVARAYVSRDAKRRHAVGPLRRVVWVLLADSSWADRRARLPWDIFAELMRRVLRPQATRRQQDAFWRGWRVVALDGTQFSLTNTPQITATTTKARTRRGRAAFAKIWTAVLLEVGLHNPLAAAIGRHGESEWALAQRLLAQLPKRALLLGDRLYGVAAFVVLARAACARVGSHFLLRASRSTTPRPITRLPDGTRLVQIALRARNARAGSSSGSRSAKFACVSAAWPPRARAAIVDQFDRSPDRARAGPRAPVRAALGARAVFPRAETARPHDRRA